MKELSFYVTNAAEINKKYRGKHIAMVDDAVVASGDDPRKVWETARSCFRSQRRDLYATYWLSSDTGKKNLDFSEKFSE